MLKKVLSDFALRLGYTVIPTWRLADYPAVEDLRRRFLLLEIELVLDVGANAGQFRDMLRGTLGYSGPIVSFEPVPHLAEALVERAAADPNWTVLRMGLGASPGSAPFNVMVGNQFSSFLAPRHDEVTLFAAENRVAEQVAVEISTLDLILPPLLERHAPRGVFLKTDTQGYDLEVLKGARATLQMIAGLQIEASVLPIYEGMPRYQEVLQYLEDHGFLMSGIFRTTPGISCSSSSSIAKWSVPTWRGTKGLSTLLSVFDIVDV